jgi:hypothetical protein
MDIYAHMDSVEKVKALMLTGDNVTVVSAWAKALIVEEIDSLDPEQKFPALNVQCGDEVKRASLGDYVIKHEDGRYDVKRPIEFRHDYVLT